MKKYHHIFFCGIVKFMNHVLLLLIGLTIGHVVTRLQGILNNFKSISTLGLLLYKMHINNYFYFYTHEAFNINYEEYCLNFKNNFITGHKKSSSSKKTARKDML